MTSRAAEVVPRAAARAGASAFAIAALLILTGHPATADAQPADSAALVRTARDAQRRFESTRRRSFSSEPGGGSGECDARIGRFCYWADGGEVSEPPPEPAGVARARDLLVNILDTAAAQLPGDSWLAAQRVRYLAEAGQLDRALSAARHCRAESWLCAALAGYALHLDGRYAAAESSFAIALAAMPAERRCAWLDVRALLEDDVARHWPARPCSGDSEEAARVWWLATPLFLDGGNALRSEHFARWMRTIMESASHSPTSVSWSRDLEELTVRYGWQEWYTRVLPATPLSETESFVGHDRSPSYHFFLVVARGVANPASASPDDWDLARLRARSRFAPRSVRQVHPLVATLSVLPRGDSMVIVAAYDAGADTAIHGDSVRVGLFAGGSERDMTGAIVQRAARHGSLVLRVGGTATIASAEMVDSAARVAARFRTGLGNRNSRVLSDIVTFDPPADGNGDFSAVVAHARADLHVRRGATLGAYWEARGLRHDAPVAVSVLVEPVHRGLLRRLAESTRLAARPAMVSLRWSERPAVRDGVSPRAITLDLSALPAGTYRLRVEVRQANGSAGSSERIIRIG